MQQSSNMLIRYLKSGSQSTERALTTEIESLVYLNIEKVNF